MRLLTFFKCSARGDYIASILSERKVCSVGPNRRSQPLFRTPEEELEFFLRPTVSRPVRLGIGPPFGALDQILSCSSFFV
jgi:hypothetical protein